MAGRYIQFHTSFSNLETCLAVAVIAWSQDTRAFPWGPDIRRNIVPSLKPGICLGPGIAAASDPENPTSDCMEL